MRDIAITQDTDGQFDIALDGPDLAKECGLHSSILISLFTDRQAEPDDVIPDGTDNRRGWWANPKLGSRLWLLDRITATDDVLDRAREYCIEALQWMIDDAIAKNVNAEAEFKGYVLVILITITLADGSRHEHIFKHTLGAV